ncbi:MAG: hypothetical protein U0793_03835 [Gemmataceae bacterium]
MPVRFGPPGADLGEQLIDLGAVGADIGDDRFQLAAYACLFIRGGAVLGSLVARLTPVREDGGSDGADRHAAAESVAAVLEGVLDEAADEREGHGWLHPWKRSFQHRRRASKDG